MSKNITKLVCGNEIYEFIKTSKRIISEKSNKVTMRTVYDVKHYTNDLHCGGSYALDVEQMLRYIEKLKKRGYKEAVS